MSNDPTDLTRYPLGTGAFVPADRNAGDFDRILNGSSTDVIETRTGKRVDSYERTIVNKVGFNVPVDYAAGINITTRNQTVLSNGVAYFYTGTLPYTTPAMFDSSVWQSYQGVRLDQTQPITHLTLADAIADNNSNRSQLLIASLDNASFRIASDQAEYDSYPDSAKFTDASSILWVVKNPTNIKQLGATGSGDEGGIIDDYANLCRLIDIPFVVFQDTPLTTSTAVDLQRIRFINIESQILSTLSTGDAVTIGFDGVSQGTFSFASIRIRVVAECDGWGIVLNTLRSSKDVHIECIRPTVKGAGIVIRPSAGFNAYNIIEAKTFGCTPAFEIVSQSASNMWSNENVYYLELGAGSGIPENSEGLVLSGDNSPNNNVFIKPSIEGFDRPIVFESGTYNRIIQPRLEFSGNIVFEGESARNIVEIDYPHRDRVNGAFETTSIYPNFVTGVGGVLETVAAIVEPRDFVHRSTTDNRNYISKKCKSANNGDFFDHMTTTDRTFTILSNDRALVSVPCTQYNVFRIRLDEPTASMQAGSVHYIVTALDENGAELGTLNPGNTPYLGSSFVNSLGNSGTSNSIDVRYDSEGLQETNNSGYVQVNRSEVKFIQIELVAQKAMNGLFVYLIQTTLSENFIDRRLVSSTDFKYISDLNTDLPDYNFQNGILMSNSAMYVGINGAWQAV